MSATVAPGAPPVSPGTPPGTSPEPEPEPGAASEPGASLIHEAVARHAAHRPDAVALVDGDRRVGYAELDAAAEAWAAALLERGAGPGVFVPVVLRRSATLVAALLGVLKTGAAYAALDPDWPAERLRSVAGMLAPRVTVAAEGRDGWADGVLCPPAAHGLLPRDATAAPPTRRGAEGSAARPPVDGSCPATVFFTSGTTGRPKAVVSGHRATLSLLGGCFEPFTVTAGGPGRPVMPQAAPVSWDGFTLEAWGPLINGGTSVLIDGGYLMPGTLRTLVEREGVDTVWLTASLFHLFVDEDPGCFEGLRHVLTGGERLSVPRVRAFLDRHPSVRLTNGYGPVETCVFATARRVRRSDCDVPSGIPVGEPVPGRRVHLLTGGRPAAPGATAEICVSGDGIALGYLGDAELTARAFPTVTVDGVPTRMYRTGDLGFQDPDGVVHFTGRADRQVKVRGHRVEPEEVEAVVRTVAGVADCAVVPVPGASGGHERLALFYTWAPAGDPPPPRAVRRGLAGRLPRHLVPDLVRELAELPLTANGKLDRAALLRTLRPAGDGTEAGA
ncbi:amino acid adenylation domain-containing protein [Streptomyces ficellus]|uniref:Amino acid adenylation domain-containing protein n=1 Tax=Streptomyces ficellus TaxID=1977088 RepID=A0A6I6FIW5_9ACTN|nr:amino acid adenylation domain-containing protein [Streptomyces ficellus]QGV77458.1 amino acid adenylation domain-containing protein [Streptomyces ficellus]